MVGQGLASGQGRRRRRGPRRRGTLAPGQVEALDRGAPAPPGRARAEQQLLVDRERAGGDVAACQAGVGRLKVGRAPGLAGQDPVAEPGGVGLDGRLHPLQERLGRPVPAGPGPGAGRVRGRDRRDVGVAPQGVLAGRGPGGVGQRLLAEDERRPARQQAVRGLPGGTAHLGQGVADVDDAGPAALLGRPRHLAVQGPVDLEGPEAGSVVAHLGQGPGRERLRPGQADQRAHVQGAKHRPAGAHRVAAGLDGHRPALLDHDPVDPAPGGDLDPVVARLGGEGGRIMPVPPSTTGMPKRWPSMDSSRA